MQRDRPPAPPLLISALYYDTYVTGEPDEAFQIYNPLAVTVSLAGWKVTAGARTVTFPPGITLHANTRLWCARKATDFRQTFGVSPGCEYGGDSDPAVPDLSGTAPTFTNTGGRVTLTLEGLETQVDVEWLTGRVRVRETGA